MFGIGLYIRLRVSGGYIPTDIDALNYITAAGYKNNALKQIIDNFFIDLKATGQYSKISLMKLFITDSTNNSIALTQCGINAVAPLANVPTYYNNPTANYSGILYNGINQYAKSNYNPISDVKWGENDATLMGYVGLDTTSVFIGARNDPSYLSSNVYLNTNNNGTVDVGLNSFFMQPSFGVLASGFISVSRTSNNSTAYFCRNNNINLTFGSSPTLPVTNTNLFEGGITIDGGVSVAAYGNQRLQYILAGSGMSISEQNSIQPLVNALQGSIDTLFGLTGSSARKKY